MNLTVTDFEPNQFVLYGWCKQDICWNVTEEIWKTITLIFHLPYLSKLQFGLWISGIIIRITDCLCIVSTFWSTFPCSFSNGVAELHLSYMKILTQFSWNLENKTAFVKNTLFSGKRKEYYTVVPQYTSVYCARDQIHLRYWIHTTKCFFKLTIPCIVIQC